MICSGIVVETFGKFEAVFLGLPLEIILNPNPQNFGLINTGELFSTNTQVRDMWCVTEVYLKGLALFRI